MITKFPTTNENEFQLDVVDDEQNEDGKCAINTNDMSTECSFIQ